MDLELQFANGAVTGEGIDDVGRFTIKGRFDPTNRECYWTKTYLGAHEVYYRGFREGKGIWGTWEIVIQEHGGFHIWPWRFGQDETRAECQTEAEPSEAVASGASILER